MPIASSLLDKPRLMKKLRDFYNYVQKNDGKIGTKTRGIDLNFNNACNLRCKYCFTNSPKETMSKNILILVPLENLQMKQMNLAILNLIYRAANSYFNQQNFFKF